MYRERVAIDLDCVISDTDVAILEYLAEEHNLHLSLEDHFEAFDFERNPYLSQHVCDGLRKEIDSGNLFKRDIPPTTFAEHGVGKLVRENFSVYIVTARKSKHSQITRDWFKKNNIHFDNLVLTSKSSNKAHLIKQDNCVALIEDRFDVITDVLRLGGLKYGIFVVDRPWNRHHYHPDVVRVISMHEACDQIVENRRKKIFGNKP
jgi:uncharacterized HAD superfamily protein